MQQIVKLAVGLLLLTVLVGCGSKGPRSGVVSGKITYKTRPVNGAALLLSPTSDSAAEPITVPVAHDGNYSITDLPKGEYKIVVQGSAGAQHASLQNVPPEKQAEAKAKMDKMNTSATIPFPDKYKQLQTTDLKCTITDKDQTLNLELKD